MSAGRRSHEQMHLSLEVRMLSQDDREQMILRNIPLARHIAYKAASRYGGLGAAQMDEAFSDAYLGLIYAVDHFDAGRGVRFGAYASRAIAWHVQNGFRDRDPVSRRTRRIVRAVEEAAQAQASVSGEMPSTAALVREHPEYGRALGHIAVHVAVSLDAASPDEQRLDVPADTNVEDVVTRHDEYERVRRALAQLDERSQYVVIATVADDTSASQLARDMHVTHQRVQQIRKRALTELRSSLLHEESSRVRRGSKRKALTIA